MKITFKYDKEKDIWCILNKGKGSMNSQNPTKQYELNIEDYPRYLDILNVAI